MMIVPAVKASPDLLIGEDANNPALFKRVLPECKVLFRFRDTGIPDFMSLVGGLYHRPSGVLSAPVSLIMLSSSMV